MQNLIVYQFNTLYEILKEIDHNLNFKIIDVKNEKSLNSEINLSKKYLIATRKKVSDFDNQIIFEKFPIKIDKLIEKINVQFLKKQFNDQSKYYVKDYTIDLNARIIFYRNKKLKLTEKEIDTIMYLSKTNKTTSVQELQKKVWLYQPDIETHTVETHIYRLRQKFLKEFSDDSFIISKKYGYQIK
tara:strand:+ start:543 stop:1100 length:558 start_codon:yes stop_codon:yes gene_type:complete